MSPTGQELQVDVDGRTLTISNLDKVLYPRTGTTKGEVLNYYAQVSPVLLPHLKDRAVTRIRWPHGVEKGSFFEKNAPAGTPSWVRTHEVPTTGSRSGKGDGTIRFPICDDLATLTWLANLASLELHVHQWTVDAKGRPRNPNRLVIDLDQVPLAEGAAIDDLGFGEDYELLAAVVDSGPFASIGRCEEGDGVELLLDGKPHALAGWEHFR